MSGLDGSIFKGVTPEDSDDDMEEVFPEAQPEISIEEYYASSSVTAPWKDPIEITLRRSKNVADADKDAAKKREEANAERVLRLETHKLHTICLLANGRTRNKWINDPLLHARLMSITPLALQNSFQMISKKSQPDQKRRGRQFEAAVRRLVEWWIENYDVEPGLGIQNRPFEEVQQELYAMGVPTTPVLLSFSSKGKGKASAREVFYDEEEMEDGEVIKSAKSLMKHALKMSGSLDTSAQLFTALCRAIDVPARLVVSLQSVPWKKKATSNGKRSKAGSKALNTELSSEVNDDDDLAEVFPEASSNVDRKGKGRAVDSFPGNGHTLSGEVPKGKGKVIPTVSLRKTKPARKRAEVAYDPKPVIWTEVFSRPDGRWMPVDLMEGSVDQKRWFEPHPSDRTNRMLYVVGFEEDGYARDVTSRYARNFATKTAKIRASVKNGKKEWWEEVIANLQRPYRLNRDDTEDAEFQTAQMREGMPSSVAAFKNHPLYILERHLKRDEVLYPRIELGKFRGEPVFAQENVVSLKTSENWMRQGRLIKLGEQPLKTVKVRAVTINRRRELEAAKERQKDANDGQGEDGGATQGMYSEWQTELYVPPPIVDGKIPKNDFGNIDLYAESMLPEGAAHLPFKGVAKVARQLGIDYAEAVTGFEFRQRRAIPILTGIVVASENEPVVLEAYWESALAAEEAEQTKKRDNVLKHWSRLVQGLRIHQRIHQEYGSSHGGGNATKTTDDPVESEDIPIPAGGFLTEYEGVIRPFNLPKPQHLVVSEAAKVADDEEMDDSFLEIPAENGLAITASDSEDPLEEVQLDPLNQPPSAQVRNAIPMSMQELADEEQKQGDAAISVLTSSADEYDSIYLKKSSRRTTRSTRQRKSLSTPRSNGNSQAGANSNVLISDGSRRTTRSTTHVKSGEGNVTFNLSRQTRSATSAALDSSRGERDNPISVVSDTENDETNTRERVMSLKRPRADTKSGVDTEAHFSAASSSNNTTKIETGRVTRSRSSGLHTNGLK